MAVLVVSKLIQILEVLTRLLTINPCSAPYNVGFF